MTWWHFSLTWSPWLKHLFPALLSPLLMPQGQGFGLVPTPASFPSLSYLQPPNPAL